MVLTRPNPDAPEFGGQVSRAEQAEGGRPVVALTAVFRGTTHRRGAAFP